MGKKKVALQVVFDANDQLFVNLVLAGKADYLVTGDKDLLALDGHLPCQVVTPADFRGSLGLLPGTSMISKVKGKTEISL
ncbi:MAG: putative toxin-antitoxin system toxin component, PIN family [Desulfuromonadales bacterium]|nr:putative toxin-antitoxin system toxin component, PIN family [Desulfuromonadales bacterium]